MKKLKKNVKGVTMVALVVTIIVLLILSAITIMLTVGNNGLFSRAKIAKDEHIKKEATEAMNLKITGIQIESYTESQKLPNLQYLADKLCEDREIEYVEKETKKQASLDKVDVTGINSIFTKIKKYPYEFEIDNELKLASIDGIKIAEDNNTQDDTWKREMELAISALQDENNNLKNRVNAIEKETIFGKRTKLTSNSFTGLEIAFPNISEQIERNYGSIKLTEDIKKYKYIEIETVIVSPALGYWGEKTTLLATEYFEISNSETINWDKYNFLLENSWGNSSIGVIGYIINEKEIRIGCAMNTIENGVKMKIKGVYGIL